jgi:hypothetical protein
MTGTNTERTDEGHGHGAHMMTGRTTERTA